MRTRNPIGGCATPGSVRRRSQSGTHGSAAWGYGPISGADPGVDRRVRDVLDRLATASRREGHWRARALYLGLTVAYTVLPAFAFMVTGLSEGGPLALLLPETSDLRGHPWRRALF